MSNQSARNSESTYGKSQLNCYVLENDQSIDSGAASVPVWSLEGSDNLNGALNLGGGGELNFQKDGTYLINGYIVIQADGAATGKREVLVNLNGGLELTCASSPLKNGENIAVPFSIIVRQGLGDTVRTRALQTQGAALNLIGKSTSANAHCRVSVYRLN